MTITNDNRIMQSSVNYQIQEQKGAVAQSRTAISYDIDTANVSGTTKFTMGQIVALGVNKGIVPLATSSTAANILGAIPSFNAGTIDDAGYKYGTYTNLSVLKQGVIYLPASGTITLSTTLYLQIDPSKADYGYLINTNSAGAIDVSTIIKPLRAAANSLILVDMNIL